MICYHGIIKLKVDETIKGELREIRNESTVKCKIIENNITIFEIQTLASCREQAVKIVKNWEENTQEIYPKVIQMLNEVKKEEEENING